MKYDCERCGNKFERYGTRSKICEDCWNKSKKHGIKKATDMNTPKCTKCFEYVLPDDDRVNISLYRRNKDITRVYYPKAWKINRIAVFHKQCFKLGGLLK